MTQTTTALSPALARRRPDCERCRARALPSLPDSPGCIQVMTNKFHSCPNIDERQHTSPSLMRVPILPARVPAGPSAALPPSPSPLLLLLARLIAFEDPEVCESLSSPLPRRLRPTLLLIPSRTSLQPWRYDSWTA